MGSLLKGHLLFHWYLKSFNLIEKQQQNLNNRLTVCLCSLAAEQQQRVYVYRHHTGVSKVPTFSRRPTFNRKWRNLEIFSYCLPHLTKSARWHLKAERASEELKRPRHDWCSDIFCNTAPIPTSECKEFQILHDFKVSGRSITEIGAKISQDHLLHSFQIPKLLNVQRYITEMKNGACPGKKTFAFSFIDNIISSSSFEVF